MTEILQKIKSKVRMDAINSWWVSEQLVNRGPTQDGRRQCGDGTLGCTKWKKDEEKRMEAWHQKLVSRLIGSADGGNNGVERRSADSEGGSRRC